MSKAGYASCRSYVLICNIVKNLLLLKYAPLSEDDVYMARRETFLYKNEVFLLSECYEPWTDDWREKVSENMDEMWGCGIRLFHDYMKFYNKEVSDEISLIIPKDPVMDVSDIIDKDIDWLLTMLPEKP